MHEIFTIIMIALRNSGAELEVKVSHDATVSGFNQDNYATEPGRLQYGPRQHQVGEGQVRGGGS